MKGQNGLAMTHDRQSLDTSTLGYMTCHAKAVRPDELSVASDYIRW